MKTVEQILQKRHNLYTEIYAKDRKPNTDIVEVNNMKEYIKALEWVLED